MALLRIGSFEFNFGPKRAANLTNYDDEEPYMPGGGHAGGAEEYSDGADGYSDGGDGYSDGGDGYDDGLYEDDGGYGDEDGRGADYYIWSDPLCSRRSVRFTLFYRNGWESFRLGNGPYLTKTFYDPGSGGRLFSG